MGEPTDLNNHWFQPIGQAFQTAGNIVQAAAKAMETTGRTLSIAEALELGGGIASVWGTVFALFGVLLQAFDSSDTGLEQLLNAIAQLDVRVKENTIVQNAINIVIIMGLAKDAYNGPRGLKDKIQNRVAASEPEWEALLHQCTTTLGQLVPKSNGSSKDLNPTDMPLWFPVRDNQLFIYFSKFKDAAGWEDFYNWYYPGGFVDRSLGPMNFSQELWPTPDSLGRVFCPIAILPAYLNAIEIFLAVGLGLCPDFLNRPEYKNEIWRHAQFLCEIYQKILTEGFVFLPMPPNPWVDLNPPGVVITPWGGKCGFAADQRASRS
jgi:hypothetical protein